MKLTQIIIALVLGITMTLALTYIIGGDVTLGAPLRMQPALVIAKTSTYSAPLLPGDTITYTIVVSNSGIVSATGAVISDSVPVGANFVSGTINLDPPGAGLVGTTPPTLVSGLTITAGQQITVTFVVTVSPSLTNGTIIVNTALVTSTEIPTLTTVAITDTVFGTADLSLSKTVNKSTPNESETIVYTVVVSNIGPDDASSLLISDTLPSGVTYVSSTATPGSYSNGTKLWTVNSLAANNIATLTLTATVDAGTGGSVISNTAEVNAVDQADPDSTPNNNIRSEDDQGEAAITVPSANLFISKDRLPPLPTVDAGEILTYTIAVVNLGSSSATGLVMTDTLPLSVSIISVSPATATQIGRKLVWTRTTFNIGVEFFSVVVQVGSDVSGALVNDVEVQSKTSDPIPGNNRDLYTTTVTTLADLVVSKHDQPDPVIASKILTYTLTITNQGPSNAQAVVVSDTLPLSVSIVSVNPVTNTQIGQTLNWNLGTMLNVSSQIITVVVAVDKDVEQTISNTVQVNSNTNDPISGNNQQTEPTLVVQEADLNINKQGTPDPVVAGQLLTYTLTITNQGPLKAKAVIVTDTLPSSVTLVSVSPLTSAQNGPTLTWNLSTVFSNAVKLITVVVTVGSDVTGSITNTAQVTSSTTDPQVSNNNTSEATQVNTQADLLITKSDNPDPVIAGQLLTYTLTITNQGPSDAQTVLITDTLPTSLTVVTVNPLTNTQNGQTLDWNLGTMTSGTVNLITIVVTVGSEVSGLITNTAQVTSTTSDLLITNNTVSETTQVNTQANLLITKSDNPDPVVAGQLLTYTLTITNQGPSDAQTVLVTDTLPSSLTVVTVNPLTSTQNGQTLGWNLGMLIDGAINIITVVVTVGSDVSGLISNTAQVTSTTSDLLTTNNNTSETTQVNTQADLLITKSDNPDPVVAGQTLTYTLTITNQGPSDAAGVIITDALPAEVSFGSASTGCLHAAGLVTCNVGGVPLDNSLSITISVGVNINATGVITNNGGVSALTTDLQPSNNITFETTTVTPVASLAVTKTSTHPSPLSPTDIISYTIVVINNGGTNATATLITDTLPVNTTYISNSISLTPTGSGTPGSSPPTLATGVTVTAGANITVTFAVTVNAPLTVGTTITNTTLVTSPTILAPVTDTVIDTVNGADLVINKSSSPNPAIPGALITYTLVVSNLSQSHVSGILVSDTFPSQISGLSWLCTSSSGSTCTSAGAGNLNDTITLRGSGVATYIVTGTLAASTTNTLINTATVTVPLGVVDPSLANNVSVDTNALLPQSDLIINKSGQPDPVVAGELLTYTLAITNKGPSDAQMVIVTDTLPTSVTVTTVQPITATQNGQILSWTLGSLADGGTTIITVVVTVGSDVSGGITNTAQVTSSATDPQISNNNISEATQVNTQANLLITKSDTPDPVVAGQLLTYTLTITNQGPSDAQTVLITDTLPTSLTVVTVNPLTNTQNGQTLGWNMGTMTSGAVNLITIVVAVGSDVNGLITNTAQVTSTTSDLLTTNNTISATTQVNTQANLLITKSDNPDPVIAGQTLTYTLTITNQGPSDAQTVPVTDTLPASLTVTSVNPLTNTQNGQTLGWNLGTLIDGAVKLITVVVTVGSDVSGAITNTAQVTATTSDPLTTNNNTSETTQVNTQADLLITKSDNPDPVVAGQTLTYTLTITNQGPSDAAGVIITDALPSEVSFGSASAGCIHAAGLVTCNAGNVPPDNSLSITISVGVNINATGVITNNGGVSALTTDLQPSNNITFETTTVTPIASLAVAKTSTHPSPLSPTDIISYTIVVMNNGGTNAIATLITDTLPVNTTYISNSISLTPPGSGTPGSFPPTLASGVTITAGTSVTVTFAVTVSAPLTVGTTITNTAFVTSPTILASVTDTVIDTVNGADLAINKSSSPNPAIPGTLITYTLVVSNLSQSHVSGILVSDTFPSQISGLSWLCNSSSGSTCTSAGAGNLNDTITLRGSGVATYIVTGTLAASTTNTLINTATVTAPLGVVDPLPANNLSIDINIPSPQTDLIISKRDSSDPVVAGQLLTYTLTITNQGPSDATGVVITDTLPAAVSFVAAPGCTQAGSVVTCTVGGLSSNSSISFTIGVNVNVAASGTLTNTAWATATTTDPAPGNNVITETTAVNPVVSLAVTKTSVHPLPLTPGDTITYTIVVRNNGGANATGTLISDTLSANANYVTNTITLAPTGSGTPGTVPPTLASGATITAGTNITITFAVTVSTPLTAGTIITNRVVVTSPDILTTVTNTVSDTVQGANLAISKSSSPNPAIPGQIITYTIIAGNPGASHISGATVTDTFPTDISNVSWVCSGSGSAICTGSGTGNINDSLTLPVGNIVTYTITGTLASSATNTLVNTATVITPLGITDTVTANNITTDTNTPSPQVDLMISKSDNPDPVIAGQILTYTITITNQGTSDAVGIVLTDVLPVGVTYGGQVSITLPLSGPITTTKMYWTDIVTDAVQRANFDGSTVEVLVTGLDTPPEIAVDAIGNKVYWTDIVTNKIQWANLDGSNVQDVVTGLTAPFGIALDVAGGKMYWTDDGTNKIQRANLDGSNIQDVISVGLDKPFGIALDVAGGKMYWADDGTNKIQRANLDGSNVQDLVTIGLDDPRSIALDVAGGKMYWTDDGNNVIQRANLDGSNIQDVISVGLDKPFGIDLDVAGGKMYWADSGTNKIQRANLDGSNVQDVIAAGLADPAGIALDQHLNWYTPTLKAGTSIAIIFTVTVHPNISGTITNSVAISSSTTETNTLNDTDHEPTTVIKQANLTITKTAAHTTPLQPGDTITYTIVAGNNGPSTSRGGVISDTLPTNTNFISGSITLNPSTAGITGTVVPTLATQVSLNVGAQITVTFAVTVNAPLTAGTIITNTASITSIEAVTLSTSTVTTTITGGDLSIGKSSSPIPAIPGVAITYTIVVSNPGQSHIVNATVSDTIPAAIGTVSWSCVGSVGSACTASGTGHVNDVITVLSGGSVTYTITGTLASSTTSTLVNTATVSLPVGTTDIITASNVATDTNTPVPQTDLVISKGDNPDPVMAGTLLTYTLIITNQGPSDAVGVVVTDILPAGISFNSAPGCTQGGGVVTCNVGVLTANTSVSFTIGVSVNMATAGTLTNSATVTVTTNDPQPGNNTVTETTTITPVALLAITKTSIHSSPLTPGDTITYTIVIKNSGGGDATGTSISDTLPAELNYVTNTINLVPASGTLGSAPPLLAGSVTITAGTSVTVTFAVTVSAPLTVGTVITNIGVITSPDISTVITDLATVTVRGANLAINKSSNPLPAIPGETITYTIIVSNPGSSHVIGATVTDTFPAEISNIGWICNGATGSTCTANGTGNINDNITLLAGGVVTYIVTGTLASSAVNPLINTATVIIPAGVTETLTANNVTTDTNTLAPQADLTIDKRDQPDPVIAGELLTYTLTITNQGPSDAQTVIVTDTLPASTTVVSVSSVTNTQTGQTLDWNLGMLVSQGTQMITVVVRVNSALSGAITNTAQVTATTTDPITTNNSALEQTQVDTEADLAVSKYDQPDPVIAGDLLTYTLTITNSGPSDAQMAVVTDTLPTSVTITSVQPATTTQSGQILDWNLGTLVISEARMITVVVRVNSMVSSAITNTVQVTSTTTDPQTNNNSISEGTQIATAADLIISKRDSPDPALAGELLTYTLTITNQGPSDGQGVVVTDTLPTGASIITTSLTTNTQAGQTLGWNLGTVVNSGTQVITVVVRVNSALSGAITNSVGLTSTTIDPANGNNTTSEATQVDTEADLIVSKQSKPNPVRAGELLTYTVIVTNQGPSDAQAVVVTDTLPPEVAFSSAPGCTELGGVVTCTASTLANSNSISFTIVVQVNIAVSGAITNSVGVTSTTTDPVPGNNINTTGVTPIASLGVTKISAYAAPLTPGNTMTYTIVIENSGGANATGVLISDTLPAELNYVTNTISMTPGGNGALGTSPPILASGVTVTAGTRLTVTLAVTVSAPLTVGTVLTNMVVLTSPDISTVVTDTTVDTVQGANLAISKGSSPIPAIPGETITYTIVVSNLGSSHVSGAIVTDTFPAGINNISWVCSGSGCTGNGFGDLNDTITLSSGSIITYTITGTLIASATNTLVNTATALVPAGVTETIPANNAATDTNIPLSQVDLTISKHDTPDPAIAGRALTYTLIVTNHGPSYAPGVIVTDTLPASLTIASTTPATTSQNSQTLGWNLNTLTNGESRVITVVMTVSSAVSETIANTAQVTTTVTELTPTNNIVLETTQINSVADLSVTKIDNPDPVIATKILTYTLTITNSGPSDAVGVVVTDTLLFTTTVLNSSPPTSTQNGQLIGWNLGTLTGGESRMITLTLQVGEDVRGVVSNIVDVSSSTNDPNLSNNQQVITTTVIPNEADLKIAKGGVPFSVLAGELLTYTLNMNNIGPVDAELLVLTDTLPVSVTVQSVTPTTTTQNGQILTWDLGTLSNNGSTVVTVVVRVDSGGFVNPLTLLTNNTDVSSAIFDPIADNTDSKINLVTRASDLVVGKQDNPDPVVAGETLTYTLTITNLGPSDVLDVVLTDTLPLSVTVININPVTNTQNGQMLGWNLGAIVVGMSKTITVVVTVDRAITGSISNQAQVTGSTTDPVSGNNQQTEPTLINTIADLIITKQDNPNPVSTAAALTYTLSITNLGPSVARAITVTDILPPGTIYNIASGNGWSCNHVAGVVTCTRLTLAVGVGPDITLLVTTPITGAVLINMVSISSTTLDPITANNSTAINTTATAQANLAVSKKSQPSLVVPGQPLTYTLTYTNLGPHTAVGLVITDILPVTLTNVGSTSSGVTITPTTGFTYAWQVADMSPGSGGVITITGLVSATLANDSILTNITTITTNQSTLTVDPNATNNSDTVTTTINLPRVSFSAASYNVVENPGPAIITVTLNITPYTQVTINYNTGNGTATATTDYITTTGSLTFTAGTTLLTFTVPITNDALDENNETVQLALSNPSSGVFTTSPTLATLTIIDDDPLPVVSFSGTPYSISESSPTATITVTLSAVSGRLVTVAYNTGDNTATLADNDYVTTSGILSFTPGITVQTFTVGIISDNRDEPDEIVNLNLSAASNTTGTPAITNLTIIDDDAVLLSVSKSNVPTSTGILKPNDIVTYTIVVSNSGNAKATGAVISDTTPANTTFIPGSAVLTPAGAGTISTPPALITGLTITNGESITLTFAVRANFPLPKGTIITNTVSVTSTEPISAQTDTVTNTITGDPILSIRKHAVDANGPPLEPTDTITYTIVVTNSGNANATGAVISDSLPGHTNFVSIGLEPASAGTVGTNPPTLVNNLTITASEGVTVTFVVTVTTPLTTGTIITNTVSVTGTEVSTPITDTITNSVTATPNVQIVKTGDLSAAVGSTQIFSFSITNIGNTLLQTVTVKDSLVSGATFVGGDNGDGWLDLTETWLYTVAYTIPATAGTVLTNTGYVTATDPVGVQTTDTATHSTTLFGFTPILTITKNGPSMANVGDTIIFTFTISHTAGSDRSPVSNVSVNDNFAGTATRISGDNGNDLLEMGEIWIYTAAHTVLPTDPNPLINTGTVQAQDIESDVISATATHSTVLAGFDPQMEVFKTGPFVANINDTVVFTFSVINLNLISALKFNLNPIGIAALGDGSPLVITSVVDSIAGPGVYVSGDTNLNGKVDVAELWVYTATYTIVSTNTNALTNVVNVLALDPENDVISATDEHITDIIHGPILKLVKTGPLSATVGQTVIFTFTVNHDVGSDDTSISNLSITDNVAGLATTPIAGDLNSNAKLDANEVWTYTLNYTIQPGDSNPLVNTATVQGRDVDNDLITAGDSHSTLLDTSGLIYLPIITKNN